jgi:hypothetical protein
MYGENRFIDSHTFSGGVQELLAVLGMCLDVFSVKLDTDVQEMLLSVPI